MVHQHRAVPVQIRATRLVAQRSACCCRSAFAASPWQRTRTTMRKTRPKPSQPCRTSTSICEPSTPPCPPARSRSDSARRRCWQRWRTSPRSEPLTSPVQPQHLDRPAPDRRCQRPALGLWRRQRRYVAVRHLALDVFRDLQLYARIPGRHLSAEWRNVSDASPFNPTYRDRFRTRRWPRPPTTRSSRPATR